MVRSAPVADQTQVVSDRFARKFAKAVVLAARQYPGGQANLELVLDDLEYISMLHRHWDERAAARRQALTPPPPLLEFITTTELRVLPSFTAADHYRTENTPDRVKLGWIGHNFRRFLQTDGGQTIDVPVMTVRVHRLTANATTAAIVAAVGDSGRFPDFVTAAAAMWASLTEQPTGQSGDLLLNGFANILSYPEGAVCCFWDADCDDWGVEAYPVSDSYEWDAGCQVFFLADSH